MQHPRAHRSAVVIAALAGLGSVCAFQSRSDAAIDRARRVSAAALDPALTAQPFEEWFRRLVDSPAGIRWEVNDCGEQTGDPSVDAKRDLPICAEAQGTLRSAPGVEGASVVVRIVVGTERTGIAARLAVSLIYIEQGTMIQEVDRLANLEGAIGGWRDGPSPFYRPDLPAAVANCCAGLRLPGARDIEAPWSLSRPNFAIEGDFNGDGVSDVAVLLIDPVATGAPTLAVFERREGRYTLAHRRKLDRVDDVSIDAPQQVVLRLVRRRETWTPEHGDVPTAYPHAFEAVEFATHKASATGAIETRQHLIFWDGTRYSEY